MSKLINTAVLTPIQAQAARYTAQSQLLWNQLAQLFSNLTEFIYNNPQADPQTVFSAFGTSAADLLTMGAAYAALVQSYTGVTPASPVPLGATLTANAEGTVTFTPAPAPATPAPAPAAS